MYSVLRRLPTLADITLTQRSGIVYKNVNVHNGTFRSSIQNSFLSKQPIRKCFGGGYYDPNNIALNRLWKPFAFTIVFTSGSLAVAAIWQYETMRAHAISMIRKNNAWFQATPQKTGEWREKMNQWWKSLSEADKVFYPICLMNVLVFAAFRIPALQPTMIKYFCSNPAAQVLCWPMVLSTFSHYNLFHLGINMFVLHSFSPGAIGTLGKEQFVGMYLAGGVISSMASYLHKTITRAPGLSLGASGAIMAVLGFMCSQYPDSRLSIIFLPMVSFTAATGIKVVMALDMAGIILGWRAFDHAAHLGGALWGIFWCYVGNSQIWAKREPLLQFWHNIRGSAK